MLNEKVIASKKIYEKILLFHRSQSEKKKCNLFFFAETDYKSVLRSE